MSITRRDSQRPRRLTNSEFSVRLKAQVAPPGRRELRSKTGFPDATKLLDLLQASAQSST